MREGTTSQSPVCIVWLCELASGITIGDWAQRGIVDQVIHDARWKLDGLSRVFGDVLVTSSSDKWIHRSMIVMGAPVHILPQSVAPANGI